ncbi:hypothetical protein AB0O47_20570 [Streptomyces noursei]|uniref:hypothetical protein n=1 Tax=Streptomyces noursei TaxID=1971 RepID=UPI00344C3C73
MGEASWASRSGGGPASGLLVSAGEVGHESAVEGVGGGSAGCSSGSGSSTFRSSDSTGGGTFNCGTSYDAFEQWCSESEHHVTARL